MKDKMPHENCPEGCPCDQEPQPDNTERLVKKIARERKEELRILGEELGTSTYKFEGLPQPATCPDCNGTGINPFKFPDARCPCTYPADQPKHCTSKVYDVDTCQRAVVVGCEDCPTFGTEQPTQMPLREQIKNAICSLDCKFCDGDGQCLVPLQVDAVEQVVQDHDSAIAAQARKRTLKYVEATLERAFVNLSPIEQGVLNICLAHIRSIAEKEG